MYLAGCLPYQKNGQIVRQVVGYDRFTGELAYRQLTELYRALRVYVNCFQPSMKLQSKERDGSKLRRTYDRAQTPMQRLVASSAVSSQKQQELLRITEALDPLRLLTQLEQLQKALWRHAVTLTSEQSEALTPLRFSVHQCTEETVPVDGLPHTPPSLLKRERKKRSQRTGRPHDWRTREDPFEGVWEEVTGWLEARPDLTAAEIFRDLQSRYPERWRETQARTLRRGVQRLRERLLVTFHDGWGEEILNGQALVPELRAEVVRGA